MKQNPLKYLSLFSGIGGFELGIQYAYEDKENRVCETRIRTSDEMGSIRHNGDSSNSNDSDGSRGRTHPICIGYSEIDKYAIQIYNKHFNHKNYGDITTINTNELPDFDFLVGGFPCQSFSIAGKRGGFDDTRGTLFFEIAKILRDKRPRYLLLENVKGLLSHDNGKTFQTILKVLTDLGYDVEWQVLNSKNHGVPQNRERIFFVGCLGGGSRPKVFPIGGADEETNRESGVQQNGDRAISRTLLARDYKDPKVVRVADYRNDEGLRIRKGNESPYLSARRHSETDISTMPPLSIEQPKIARATQLFNLGMQGRRQKPESEPSFTLDSLGSQGITLDSKIRRLTPTECERLQGFPDGWTEGVSDTQRYKTLGNAVTVNVIQEIIKKIIDKIN